MPCFVLSIFRNPKVKPRHDVIAVRGDNLNYLIAVEIWSSLVGCVGLFEIKLFRAEFTVDLFL